MSVGAHAVACLLALAACLPSAALAAPSVRLSAGLHPEVLGHTATVSLRMQITTGGELVPPPLIEADLRYPAGMDVELSGLGIDACSVATLELSGPQGCPPDSLMGRGYAIAELPIKHEAFREAAKIAILRTAEQEGHPALLLYVYGETAVSAQIVLPAQLLPADGPFGGLLAIHAPLVPSLPETPDVSVGEIQLVLGPQDLTYYERVHHKLLAYKPAGIGLPKRCPRGGFRFAVELGFLGGAHADGATAVPCPTRSRRGGAMISAPASRRAPRSLSSPFSAADRARHQPLAPPPPRSTPQ
jgi:hypothetical protein